MLLFIYFIFLSFWLIWVNGQSFSIFVGAMQRYISFFFL